MVSVNVDNEQKCLGWYHSFYFGGQTEIQGSFSLNLLNNCQALRVLSEYHFARGRTSPLVNELSAKPALQEPLLRELMALSTPWSLIIVATSIFL